MSQPENETVPLKSSSGQSTLFPPNLKNQYISSHQASINNKNNNNNNKKTNKQTNKNKNKQFGYLPTQERSFACFSYF